MRKHFFIAICSVLCIYSHAQVMDSLRQALKLAKHDTTKIRLQFEIGNTEPIYRIGYWDTLKTKCEAATKINNNSRPLKEFYLKRRAEALNNLGYLVSNQSDLDKALSYHTESIKIFEELNDKLGLASAYNNIGLVYDNQGIVPKALEYYQKSLKLREETRSTDGQPIDKEGLAYSLNNLGTIYAGQGDNKKALDYFIRSKKIREEIKDENGLGESMNNIGFIYIEMGKISTGLEYYLKSLALHEKAQNSAGMALAQNNIGHLYYEYGDLSITTSKDEAKKRGNEKALKYYEKSLKNYEAVGDKQGMAISFINYAAVKLEQGNLNEAKIFGEKSLALSKEIGFPQNIQFASKTLAGIYSKMGNYKDAYAMQVLFKQMSDSVSNETNRKLSIQKGFQYEYEKKAAADSVRVEEERKVITLRLKQERTQRFALYGGIGLIAVFTLFIYNRFRITRKQKLIIEDQKKEVDQQRELADSRRIIAEEQRHIIEEKQKEILDSIHYAKRIQEALLTGESYINEHFGAESFILYQPKDIVSGDFYWAVSHHGRFYIATGDCTGHGVPGAFMSLLNISFLNENVIERGISLPGNILNEQRKEIIKSLNPRGDENSKDGMDCVLCAYDLINKKLDFAAANNPLWLVRNNELIEYKADKMPVGKGEDNANDFRNQSIQLEMGDIIYTFTDGYADQFGGPKGKKFKYKQLEEVILANVNKPMQEQKAALLSIINEWKGALEQVDDILVIGVRV